MHRLHGAEGKERTGLPPKPPGDPIPVVEEAEPEAVPDDGEGKGEGKGRGKGVGRGRGGGGAKYTHYPVKSRDGRDVGYLLINANAKSIDAHCELHGSTCAVGRTYMPYVGADRLTPVRAAKGRPCAFLVAWLRAGLAFDLGEAGRDAHFAASKAKDAWACLGDGDGNERQEARADFEADAVYVDVRRVERQPRDGEGIEPKGRFP